MEIMADKIFKTSRKFDLDSSEKDSKYDILVGQNIL